MPAKMARSAPRSPFGLPEATAVVRAASLSCQNEGKAPKILPKSGAFRGIWGRLSRANKWPWRAVTLGHRNASRKECYPSSFADVGR